ncbi:MAG: hypothetical protein IJ667_01025 [Synergistaceae bacterium]|nr:hypothetical protein [Synergistaceae bacterium]
MLHLRFSPVIHRPVLQAFSYARLIGIIAGTWSSMFVATGFLIEWYLAKPEGKKR